MGSEASLLDGNRSRWWHHRLAEREAEAGSVGATKVLLIEPDEAVVSAADAGDRVGVATQAARRTLEALADPDNRKAVEHLSEST